MPDLLDQLRTRRASTATSEPVLTREQNVSDWLAARGAFDRYADEPLSLQRYLRGMATGEWDGAEHERALAAFLRSRRSSSRSGIGAPRAFPTDLVGKDTPDAVGRETAASSTGEAYNRDAQGGAT